MIEDRDIAEALRLADITDIGSVTYSPAHVLAHAATLAKLRIAVEALDKIGDANIIADGMACKEWAQTALTKIRSENNA